MIFFRLFTNLKVDASLNFVNPKHEKLVLRLTSGDLNAENNPNIQLKYIDASLPAEGMSDIYSFLPGLPVISGRAMRLLKEFSKANIDFLKCSLYEQDVFIVIIKQWLDAIDIEKTEFRMMFGIESGFNRLILSKLKTDCELDVFRLSGYPYYNPIVSLKFKNAIEKEKLVGFGFEKIDLN